MFGSVWKGLVVFSIYLTMKQTCRKYIILLYCPYAQLKEDIIGV